MGPSSLAADAQEDGVGGVMLSVRPYLMDLKTTNGEKGGRARLLSLQQL